MTANRPVIRSPISAANAITTPSVGGVALLSRAQLLQEVGDSVENAEQAYQAELDDVIVDLRLAATFLSNDTHVQQAICDRDAKTLEQTTQAFARLYPDMVIAFLDKDSAMLARIGCDPRGLRSPIAAW